MHHSFQVMRFEGFARSEEGKERPAVRPLEETPAASTPLISIAHAREETSLMNREDNNLSKASRGMRGVARISAASCQNGV